MELKETNHSYYFSESNYYVGGQNGENYGRSDYDTWEDFMEEWRTTEELAWEATKTIPRHWKQISVYVLGQILRPLLADGYITKTKNSSNVSSYRRRRFIN